MKDMGHKKTQNTALIYEILTAKIIKDFISEKYSPALEITKKYFAEGTILKQELDLYNTILNISPMKEEKAKDFLGIIVENYKHLNHKNLSNERYRLIGEIRESYDIVELFDTKITDYKLLASINKYFNFKINVTECYSPSSIFESLNTILERIRGGKPKAPDVQTPAKTDFDNLDSMTKLLACSVAIKKYNKKYKGLNEKQKKLLNKYILEDEKIKTYMMEEVVNVKKAFIDLTEGNQSLRIKITELTDDMKLLKEGKFVSREQITVMLKLYSMVDLLNAKKIITL